MKTMVLSTAIIMIFFLACSSVLDNEGSVYGVTLYPGDVTAIEGRVVMFCAKVTGDQSPVVKWERSSDGKTWSVITGAGGETYSFVTSRNDNGSFFRARAVYSDVEIVSEIAALTIVAAQDMKQVIEYGLK